MIWPCHTEPMPHAMRAEYPGAISHVLNRGNTFVTEVGRQDFLKMLAEAGLKNDWQAQPGPSSRCENLRFDTPQTPPMDGLGNCDWTRGVRRATNPELVEGGRNGRKRS
jgi:hypothetical protein